MVNPTVFFDIAVNGEPLGRTSFEHFADKIPKRAEKFCALSTGKELVMRVLASCPWQMLDPTQTVPSFSSALPRLDGKHVVFGKVKEDMISIVDAREHFGSRNGKTSKKITIADCGQL
ncbi:hypothetical protein P7K49_023749 [Saguinus oedipus]|uniref:PPIase cyclophilin-type domain-containing protein n=1 Tax=Saguinus oedipus TaxID=9490 RepID=A0ABQ9UMI8_SAGOE|nr:hypothetical protein P7K49_023749 [Saguinus oedipus]